MSILLFSLLFSSSLFSAMEKSWNPLFSFLSLCLILPSILEGHERVVAEARYSPHHHRYRAGKGRASMLFVFGDSYVDTGNSPKTSSNSWRFPYGITFPGKPAGRSSDGRLLTDLLATFVGLKTPVAYQLRDVAPRSTRYGMNFGTGGTGVFDTLIAGPNLTTQIDHFQSLLGTGKTYNLTALDSSVALVTISGNDYGAYLGRKGSIEGLPTFISQVVNQLAADVKRIHKLGVRKILVTALGPLGCLPSVTIGFSYKNCSETLNAPVTYHNQLLQQAVANLSGHGVGDKLSASANFTLIDLYSAFSSVLNITGNSTFENPLKPCCIGTSPAFNCGSVDDKTGEKKYKLCSNPKGTFFWDALHPTQEGWRAVFSKLTGSLQHVIKDMNH